MILLEHARRRDEIGGPQPFDQVGEGESCGGELGGIGHDVKLRLPAAHQIDARHPVHARETGLDHVAGGFPQVADVAVRRREADPDDRKRGEGEAPDLKARR